MANVVSGLFGLSPEQVIQQQQTMDKQEAAQLGALMPAGYGAVGYGMSRLGSGAIRGLSEVFGMGDPTLMKARDIEQIMKDTQSDLGANADPATVYQSLYNRLSDKGYSNEAMFALDARQKYLDNKRTLDLKQKEVEATISTAQAKSQEALVGKLTTIAKNNLTDQERLREKLQTNITDKEGPYWDAANSWANQYENEKTGFFDIDNEALAKGLLQLQTELLDLTSTDNIYGIRRPLLSPDEAFKLAKEMLGQVDEEGNLKWYKGTGITGWSGAVTLPTDVKAAVIEYLEGKGMSVAPKETAPSNLTGEDLEAYNWAKENPNDPLAKDILNSLNK